MAHNGAESSLEAGVAATFDVLAWEIELAGARCIYLDSIIGELMEIVPADQRPRFVEGMHAVDLLAQHLTSLSAFARRMGENVPGEVSASVGPAIADITLGALADRMTTAFGGEEKEAEAASGDLDLF